MHAQRAACERSSTSGVWGKNTLLRRGSSIHPQEQAGGQERSSRMLPTPVAEFMTNTCLRAAWWWIMPADEANQVLEKKLSGKNKGTEWARPARQFYRLWTLSSVGESPREQGSWPKSGMTWTVVGKQRKKPKISGHRLSHPKDKNAILYSEVWSVLKVSHSGDICIWLWVQRKILCQQHSCASSLCRKDQVKKRHPGSEHIGYQIAPRPALHIEESTWPHC